MTAPENIQRAQIPAPPSRRTLLRGAAAGGVLLGGVALPTVFSATAAQAAPAPRCYTRTEWSARPPKSATQNSHTIGIEHEAST